MRNIIQQQDDLKNLPQQQLVRAMQSGTYPQFLVLSEINRRKRMTDDQARREAADDTNTVAQEVVNAAGVPQGGIAQLASAMNAKTDNTQNTGVKQMAEGGVVKAQPGGMLSNIMSLMNPYSLKNITDYNPTVLKEPEMTGIESLEVIPPDAARALEISKKIQTGKAVKSVLKEVGLTGLEAVNLIVGAGVFIGADTANAVLNVIGTVLPDDEARVVFDMAQAIEDRAVEGLFKKHGSWLQENLPRINPNFAYTFKDRKTKAEDLSLEELEAIQKSSLAAINKADTYDAFGDKPVTSLFAEGVPSEFLKGTPGFGFPRKLDQVGSPKTDAPVGFTTGQRIAPGADVFPAGPGVQPTTITDALKTPSGSSVQSVLPTVAAADVSAANDPFRLEGAAKKELFTNTLSDPSTPGIADFLDKVQNDERLSDVVKQGVKDRVLNDPKTLGAVTTDKQFFPEKDDLRSEAISNLNQRALQFLKSDTYTPPSEIYGVTDVYGPELGGLFKQTLENQQKAMPGGGGSSGLGALFAQTLENQQEGIPGGADPNAKPTLQSRFDRARLYLEGLGEDMSGMTQEDVINFAKKAGMKSLEVLDQVTDFGADKFNDIQEFYRNRKDENAARLREENLSPPDPEKTGENTEVNELIELLKTQQAATAKQSGASSAALSEYLGGLEKDKEFDKAMALANAGAAFMMPSATIGEGAAKAIKAGTSTLQKGKNSYNKNKLQVLALQGRIDAAKAAAASRSAVTGATLSSRILLAQREDLQRQLEIIAPMGLAPDGRAADKADELRRQIKEKDNQLNSMIMTASLGGTSPSSDNIYANYNLTS